MNREEKNLGSVILFIIIILVLTFGGYYLINHKELYTKDSEEPNKAEEVKSIKIDETKDYLYFTNEVILDAREGLTYKEININLNTEDAKELQVTLNNYMNLIKSSVVKEDDEIISCDMVSYEYAITSKYLSLTVNNYEYKQDEELDVNSNLKNYVFDLSNGKLLNNRDIMKNEGVTDQQIRTKIREYISNDDEVDIDATINNEYTLTISKTGKVIINTVVKTSEMDYNVGIEMD